MAKKKVVQAGMPGIDEVAADFINQVSILDLEEMKKALIKAIAKRRAKQ